MPLSSGSLAPLVNGVGDNTQSRKGSGLEEKRRTIPVRVAVSKEERRKESGF
jgi:phage-related protein